MNDTELRRTIGSRAKARRKELGLTMDYLAEKLDVNKSTIMRYEKGSIDNTKRLVIEGLANAIWQAMQADPHADDGKPYPPNYAHYLEYTDFFDGIIDPLSREVLTDAEAARNGD